MGVTSAVQVFLAKFLPGSVLHASDEVGVDTALDAEAQAAQATAMQALTVAQSAGSNVQVALATTSKPGVVALDGVTTMLNAQGQLVSTAQISGSSPIKPTLATVSNSISDIFGRTLYVDDFAPAGTTYGGISGTTASGSDWGPIIQAAVNALGAGGGILRFRQASIYRLMSGVTINQGPIHFEGHNGDQSTVHNGTVISRDMTGFDPFTLGANYTSASMLPSGAGTGSHFKDLTFYEVHPAPSSTAGTAWTPTPYDFFIKVENTYGGFQVTNVQFLGINKGIYATGCGHFRINSMYGQWFTIGLSLANCLDSPYVDYMRHWDYYSGNVNIGNYQQQNCDVILGARGDGIDVVRIFAFRCRAIIHAIQQPATAANSTTGQPAVSAGSLDGTVEMMSGDEVMYGLWEDNDSGVTTGRLWQMGNVNVDCISALNFPSPIVGGRAIFLNCTNTVNKMTVQIANLSTYRTDQYAVEVLGNSSVLHIGNLQVNGNGLTTAGAAIHVADSNGTVPNIVSVGTSEITNSQTPNLLFQNDGDGVVSSVVQNGALQTPSVGQLQSLTVSNSGTATNTVALATVAAGAGTQLRMIPNLPAGGYSNITQAGDFGLIYDVGGAGNTGGFLVGHSNFPLRMGNNGVHQIVGTQFILNAPQLTLPINSNLTRYLAGITAAGTTAATATQLLQANSIITGGSGGVVLPSLTVASPYSTVVEVVNTLATALTVYPPTNYSGYGGITSWTIPASGSGRFLLFSNTTYTALSSSTAASTSGSGSGTSTGPAPVYVYDGYGRLARVNMASIGVCGSLADATAAQYASALAALGVSKVRGNYITNGASALSAMQAVRSAQSSATIPAKFTCLVMAYLNDTSTWTQQQPLLLSMINSGLLYAIEGPNEINNTATGNGSHAYNGTTSISSAGNYEAPMISWMTAIHSFKTANASAFSSSGVLVFGGTIASGAFSDYSNMDIEGLCDAWSLHFYAGGGRQPSYNTTPNSGIGYFSNLWNAGAAGYTPNGTLPGVLTESGATTDGNNYAVDGVSQAKYIGNQQLEALNIGAQLINTYQLFDGSTGDGVAEDNFGLYKSDKVTPKPAGLLLARMQSIRALNNNAADPANANDTANFVPGLNGSRVAFTSVSNPPNGVTPYTIEYKSDGSSVIWMFNEPQIDSGGTDVTPATTTTTVYLPHVYNWRLHDPTNTASLTSGAFTNSDTVTVNLAGYPIAIELATPSGWTANAGDPNNAAQTGSSTFTLGQYYAGIANASGSTLSYMTLGPPSGSTWATTGNNAIIIASTAEAYNGQAVSLACSNATVTYGPFTETNSNNQIVVFVCPIKNLHQSFTVTGLNSGFPFGGMMAFEVPPYSNYGIGHGPCTYTANSVTAPLIAVPSGALGFFGVIIQNESGADSYSNSTDTSVKILNQFIENINAYDNGFSGTVAAGRTAGNVTFPSGTNNNSSTTLPTAISMWFTK